MAEEDLFKDIVAEEQTGSVEETTEILPEELPTRGVGEGYIRPNLDKQVITIKDAKIFGAKAEDMTKIGVKGKAKYKTCKFMVYYDTPSNDREGLSGVIQFVQEDGKLGAPTIYADGQSQAAQLFKIVALKLNKKAKDLSMSEFIKFLKNKPKVRLKQKEFVWQGKSVLKNMIEAFV